MKLKPQMLLKPHENVKEDRPVSDGFLQSSLRF